ncbi:NUDIX hydrolase [Streptomyces xiamenensis]
MTQDPVTSNAEYAASRHAVWVCATALMTDPWGRVLLVRPSYRDTWLLPGGGVEAGELPSEGCRREVWEETGLTRTPGAALAVDHVSPRIEGLPQDLPFPGEFHTVFDGGTVGPADAARIRLPAGELKDHAFLDAAEAADRMAGPDARRMLAALRARLGGTGTVYLQDGRHTGPRPPLEEHSVITRVVPGHDWPWRTDRPVAARTPVTQVWGWLFAPDGRVVILVDPKEGVVLLPGGTVEAQDGPDPVRTLTREAYEEARLTVDEAYWLGWVHAPAGQERALARMAGRVTAIGPRGLDPATGLRYHRLLATPAQAAELLGWGPAARHQAAEAARIAAERWGIPYATDRPVTEVDA